MNSPKQFGNQYQEVVDVKLQEAAVEMEEI